MRYAFLMELRHRLDVCFHSKIISLHISHVYNKSSEQGQKTEGPQKMDRSIICVLKCQRLALSTIPSPCMLLLSLTVDY